MYMHHVVQKSEQRTYPSCFYSNWFHTNNKPGRFESYFWGNKGSFSPLHSDYPLGHGWIYMISGSKRVILFPPEEFKNLGSLIGPNDFNEKFNFSFSLTEHELKLIQSCNGRIITITEGDFLVIPCGWLHQVTNLEDNTLSRVDQVLLTKHIQLFFSSRESIDHKSLEIFEDIITYRIKLLSNHMNALSLVDTLENYKGLSELNEVSKVMKELYPKEKQRIENLILDLLPFYVQLKKKLSM